MPIHHVWSTNSGFNAAMTEMDPEDMFSIWQPKTIGIAANSRVVKVVASFGISARHYAQDRQDWAGKPLIWQMQITHVPITTSSGGGIAWMQSGACSHNLSVNPIRGSGTPAGTDPTYHYIDTYSCQSDPVNSQTSIGSALEGGPEQTWTLGMRVGRFHNSTGGVIPGVWYAHSWDFRILTEWNSDL